MSWTSPRDLRAQLQRLWDRGELLAGLVLDEPLFPRRLSLKTPTSAEMAEGFDAVRAWVSTLRTLPHCRVEMRAFKHRVLGANAIPAEVWIDSFDDAIALIGKRKEVNRFTRLLDLTRQRQPPLLDWLAKRPLRALDLAAAWERLLDIVAWLQAHPRPDVYLRQVDIPGVHSKFIEVHRSVLIELLDRALPPEAIDASAAGASQFAKRYGFRDKPLRIRMRLLDSKLLPQAPGRDISLDAECFAELDVDVSRVFITENEINFLAFPHCKRSLIIFGAGYGFEMLRRAEWLSSCPVYYWGDIDTHGFAILDQLRGQFPHVQSFLMDRATLFAFEALWGEEKNQIRHALTRLNAEESALYDDLRDNRLGNNLRLEQERVGYGWVEAALSRLTL